MKRITESDLKSTLVRVSAALGLPAPQYGVVGALAIDYAYGMTRVIQYETTGGGIRDLSGFGTKRQTYDYLRAMDRGAEIAKKNL